MLPPSLSKFFSRCLPRDGVILEAGCGIGLVVRRLRVRGYNCIGLDYAFRSLMRSKTFCPELPLVGGDVLRLPYGDNSLAAIVSLGVVEHLREGPGAALKEMTRVLRRGGIACVSVPYENRLRRDRPTVSEPDAVAQGLQFYQHYFSQADLKAELEKAGLQPATAFLGYSVFQILRDQVRWFKVFVRSIPYPQAWSFVLDMVPCLARWAAHMMLVAAVKP
jgi:SAM-dependent methyltransferase